MSKNHIFLDEVVIRRPTFSIFNLFKIPAQESELQEFCKNLFYNHKFKEAIYITTSDLYVRWEKSVEKNDLSIGLCYALLKYYIRSFSSSVPFGLFSSHGIINTKPRQEKRVTYLDTSVLYAILRTIPTHFLIKDFCFKFNESFYKIGDDWRYIDYEIDKVFINYSLSSLSKNEVIDEFFNNFGEQFFNWNSFKKFTKQCWDISEQEAFSILENLLDAKIVVSDLWIDLGAENILHDFYNKIKKSKNLFSLTQKLEKIEGLIFEINSQTFNENFSAYFEIHEILDSLKIDYDKNKTFCVNYIRNENISLPQNTKTVLSKAISILSKLAIRENLLIDLQNFSKKFNEKYESQEVSILELFDNDIGLSYGELKNDVLGYSNLIDDIDFGKKEKIITRQENTAISDFWDAIFSKNEKIVDLKKLDLSVFGEEKKLLGTHYAMIQHLDNNAIYLKKVGAASASNLFARFSYQNKEITQLCQKITDHENELYQDQLVCEINCLSIIRSGNIQVKNMSRPYETNFILQQKKSSNIPLNDIYVRIIDGHFILFSRKHQKQIIPFFSTYYNFEKHSPPIIKFIYDIHKYNHPNDLEIDYGRHNPNEIRYTPRLTFGENIVLQRETWNISFREIFKGKELSLDVLKEYLHDINLNPYYILNHFSEDRMILKRNHHICTEILYQELVKRKHLTLIEYNGDIQENKFIDEFVFTLKNFCKGITLPPSNQNNNHLKVNTTVKRTFSLGEEWIYLKIYTSPHYSDEIITDIFPKLGQSKMIDQWFFIRYNDPDYHLRLRIHVKDSKNYAKIIQRINEQLLQVRFIKIIDKLEYGTYKRELERYGFNSIELCERFFYYDSIFVSTILGYLQKAEISPWVYILKSIDEIFDLFDYTADRRLSMSTFLFNSFWKEFGSDNYFKKTIDVKFRAMKTSIIETINGNNLPKHINSIYTSRKNKMKQLHLKEQNLVSENHLLESLIHMNVNRFVKVKPRKHELIIYGLLMKYYKSNIGYEKYNDI